VDNYFFIAVLLAKLGVLSIPTHISRFPRSPVSTTIEIGRLSEKISCGKLFHINFTAFTGFSHVSQLSTKYVDKFSTLSTFHIA